MMREGKEKEIISSLIRDQELKRILKITTEERKEFLQKCNEYENEQRAGSYTGLGRLKVVAIDSQNPQLSIINGGRGGSHSLPFEKVRDEIIKKEGSVKVEKNLRERIW